MQCKNFVLQLGTIPELPGEETGVGILPVDLPHDFDRFYQGNHRRPAEILGPGLDLIIVKAVAKKIFKEIVKIHSWVFDGLPG